MPRLAVNLLLVACVILFACITIQAAVCPDPSPLKTGDQINIALLVWVADEPPGLITNVTGTRPTYETGYGTSFSQPYMLGIDLFVQEMRRRGPLPLRNGQSVNLNFVYINMANGAIPEISELLALGLNKDSAKWDYSPAKTTFGYPNFAAVSTLPSIPGSFMYPGYPPFFPSGMISQVLSQVPAVLKSYFNITQPFTFIVPPMLFLTEPLIYLANMVEDAQSHIIVHPFLGDREAFQCDGDMNSTRSITPDCILRGRKEDARRFETLFSTIYDTSTSQFAALDHFHTLKIKKFVLLHEPYIAGASSGFYGAQAVMQQAKQLNIALLGEFALRDGGVGCTEHWCPPVDMQSQGQTMGWEGGRSAADVARIIADLGPEALIVMASPTSAGAYAIGELFRGFQAIGWTPSAVSFAGGVEGTMPKYLPNGAADMLYTYNTKPWDPQLSGPSYRNLGSQSDYQLFPATADHDSPASFDLAFEMAYGPNRPGGNGIPHPFYSSPTKLNSVPAIGFATLERVQKMIEAGMSRDVPTLLNAAKSMSRPGMYGQVQFDTVGRTQRVNEVLQQQMSTTGEMNILAPYNLGVETIYPIPTWQERSFSVEFYSEPNEQVLLAINSVVLALLFFLLCAVLFHHKEPVIRASTPSFCVCTSLGCMLMVASNYFATLVVNDSHCAASVWLLTVGFTLAFASMFIKTFRIWKIFGRTKLTVTKLRDWELLTAVGGFVLIDVLINAIWIGVDGMSSKRVIVDPLRPAYDYIQCDYSDAAGFVYAHLAIKGGLLLVGVAITYAVRNTPSQFNESTLIALSIYNLTVCCGFGIPIIGAQLGGRNTVYLVRAFLIMFISLSTSCLLYLPKLLMLAGKQEDTLTKVDQTNRTTAVSGAGDGPRSPLAKNKSLRMVAPPHQVANSSQPRSSSGGDPTAGATATRQPMYINPSGLSHGTSTPVRTPARTPNMSSPISPNAPVPSFDLPPPRQGGAAPQATGSAAAYQITAVDIQDGEEGETGVEAHRVQQFPASELQEV